MTPFPIGMEKGAGMRKFIVLAIAAFVWKKVQAYKGSSSMSAKQNRP